MDGMNQMAQKLSFMKKEGAKPFGNKKGPEPMGDLGEGMLDEIFGPEEGSFLMAGGAEEAGFAEERDDLLLGACVTGVDSNAFTVSASWTAVELEVDVVREKGLDLFECRRFWEFLEDLVKIPKRIEMVGFGRFDEAI